MIVPPVTTNPKGKAMPSKLIQTITKIYLILFAYSSVLIAKSSQETHDEISYPSGSNHVVSDDSRKLTSPFYKVEQYQWTCGALPVFSNETYFILAMIATTSKGWIPAKRGSSNAKCALLEVNGVEVVKEVLEGAVTDGFHQTSIPGKKLGTGQVSDLDRNYVMLASSDPLRPPLFVTAPCEDQKINLGNGTSVGIKPNISPNRDQLLVTQERTLGIKNSETLSSMTQKATTPEDQI